MTSPLLDTITIVQHSTQPQLEVQWPCSTMTEYTSTVVFALNPNCTHWITVEIHSDGTIKVFDSLAANDTAMFTR